MAQIPPENWVSWRRHRLEQGETLTSVARKYRVTVASLARVNGLDEQRSAGGGYQPDYSRSGTVAAHSGCGGAL